MPNQSHSVVTLAATLQGYTGARGNRVPTQGRCAHAPRRTINVFPRAAGIRSARRHLERSVRSFRRRLERAAPPLSSLAAQVLYRQDFDSNFRTDYGYTGNAAQDRRRRR